MGKRVLAIRQNKNNYELTVVISMDNHQAALKLIQPLKYRNNYDRPLHAVSSSQDLLPLRPASGPGEHIVVDCSDIDDKRFYHTTHNEPVQR